MKVCRTHNTVSGGLVTGVKAGTATITASCAGYTASCSVTIKSRSLQVRNVKWGFRYGGQKNETPYTSSLYAFDQWEMMEVDANPSQYGQLGIYFETKEAINAETLAMEIRNLNMTANCGSDGTVGTDRTRLVDKISVAVMPGDYVMGFPPTKQASFSLKSIPSSSITSTDKGKTAIINCGDILTSTIDVDPSTKGFTVLFSISKGSSTAYNSYVGYGQIPWGNILINGKPLEYAGS